jgi:hypothetical protein
MGACRFLPGEPSADRNGVRLRPEAPPPQSAFDGVAGRRHDTRSRTVTQGMCASVQAGAPPCVHVAASESAAIPWRPGGVRLLRVKDRAAADDPEGGCLNASFGRVGMADPSKSVPEDPSFVRLNRPLELEYWCERFSVTPQALGEAVIQVGSSSAKISAYLNPATDPVRVAVPKSGGRRGRCWIVGGGVFFASCLVAWAVFTFVSPEQPVNFDWRPTL